jgi:glutamate synthase (NADPH/NADH) small chain
MVLKKRQEPKKLGVSQRSRNFNEVYGTLVPHQAIAESARCLTCYDPPCNAGCPAGIDVAGFVRSIKVKNFVGAARKLRKKNILAAICGHVCPAEKFCEAYCSITQLTEPINIKALHRFATEFELQQGLKPPENLPSNKRRVAVIGSGPSGLSCSAELRRAGYEVNVFEKLPVAGGILYYGIPPHRLPKSIVQAEIEYLNKMGLQFKLNSPISSGSGINELFGQGYEAVFIGVGLGKPISLDLPGECLKGVYTWKEVLSQINLTNDQDTLDLGKRTVVIGGGNIAIDIVTSVLRLGVEDVHLVCLEAVDEMPAFKSELNDALEEGLIIHPRSKVLGIRETGGGKVGAVECIGTKWQKAKDFSPENAMPIAGTDFSLEIDSVVEAIGQSLDAERNLLGLQLGMENRHVVVKAESGETSHQGVFAGGDVIRGVSTVVEAVRDGVIAAQGIDQYLQTQRD